MKFLQSRTEGAENGSSRLWRRRRTTFGNLNSALSEICQLIKYDHAGQLFRCGVTPLLP